MRVEYMRSFGKLRMTGICREDLGTETHYGNAAGQVTEWFACVVMGSGDIDEL